MCQKEWITNALHPLNQAKNGRRQMSTDAKELGPIDHCERSRQACSRGTKKEFCFRFWWFRTRTVTSAAGFVGAIRQCLGWVAFVCALLVFTCLPFRCWHMTIDRFPFFFKKKGGWNWKAEDEWSISEKGKCFQDHFYVSSQFRWGTRVLK